MPDLSAPDYLVARFLIERGLAAIYVVAFVVALRQFPWFLPLSPGYGERWFVPFLVRLLQGDGPTLRLLRRNPFPDAPPRWVRARLFRYRFTTWRELRATRAWWVRRPVGELVGPIRLREAS